MTELEKLLDEYEKMFDDYFPMIPLAWGRTDEEVAKLIKECLDKKKDAYEMKFVEESEALNY